MLGLLAMALVAMTATPAVGLEPPYSLPLGVDLMEEFMSDIIPCLVPCVLDNVDKFSGDILRERQGRFFQCGGRLAQQLGQISSFQEAYRLLEAYRDKETVCREGQESLRCLRNEMEYMCGAGVADKVGTWLNKTMDFLDCNPRNPRPLRMAECIALPILQNTQNAAKTTEIEICTRPHIEYLGRWGDIFQSEKQSGFQGIYRALIGMKDCVKQFMMPQLGQPQCENAANEIERQFTTLLDFSRREGVLSCMGDPLLYSPDYYLSLTRCAQNFGQSFGMVAEEIAPYGLGPSNLKSFMKTLANRACQDVNSLVSCFRNVMESPAHDVCKRWVLPTLMNVTGPAVDYFNCLGTCQTSCKKMGKCACLKDYKVDESYVGTCPTDPPTSPPTPVRPVQDIEMTGSFQITNKEYDYRFLSTLEEDIKPVVDRVLRQKFGDEFYATVQYRARPVDDGIDVSFGILFLSTFNGSPYIVELALESALFDGYLYGMGREAYRVRPNSIRAVRGLPPREDIEEREPDRTLMIVYPVLGLLGLAVVVIIVVFCCCVPRRNQRASEKKVVQTTYVTGPTAPGYITSGVHPGVYPGYEVTKVPL